MKEDSAPGPALALNVTQVTNNTLRPTTPKLSKHQTMTMTSVSRSTGRSDKAKRAQGNGLVRKGSCLLCCCPFYCCAVHVAKQYYGGVQRIAFGIAEQQHCCGVHACCIGCCCTAALAVLYSCVAFGVAAEQHEQDMLEELDRMHEECATLQDDAQVSSCPP